MFWKDSYINTTRAKRCCYLEVLMVNTWSTRFIICTPHQIFLRLLNRPVRYVLVENVNHYLEDLGVDGPCHSSGG
jgi:hypothetical protein